MTYNPAGGQTYNLATSVGSTDATILLSSFLEPVSGVAYTMALLNTDIAYGTISPRTSSSEFISFTGITQNSDGTATLTGVTRGLAKKYPFTSDAVFKLPHSGQSIFILSDVPQVFVKYASLENDNVFTGTNTFDEVPNAPAPVNGSDLTNKDYVLSVVNGGPVTLNSLIEAGIAGETITKDQLVYLKVADGRWWKCDADTAATVDNVRLGLAQGAGSAGVAITGGVLTAGLATLTAFTVTAGTKYYASNTAGGISVSVGTTEVTIGMVPSGSTTTIYFAPRFDQQITENELDAIAGGSTFGTPSATNKFVTQDYLASASGLPVVHIYTANTPAGSSTTQFDITNPSGTTFRYTFDGTGTDPNFSLVNYPIGTVVDLQAENFNSANKGLFVTTGAGANYIEVTNAAGVVESNKTIGIGYINKGVTWTKPTNPNLKYITIRQQGAGAAGDGTTSTDVACSGGSSGAYAEKQLATAVLAATVSLCVGYHVVGTTATSTGVGGRTIFNHSVPIITTGGTGQAIPGVATGGDLNINGQLGGSPITNATGSNLSGMGASSPLGIGGVPTTGAGVNATGYGGGGGGGNTESAADVAGGNSTDGVMILTEYFE